MKINLKQTIKDYKGEDLLNEKKEPTILKDILVTALNNFTQDERPTQEQKNKAFGLSVSFYAREEVDLTVEDRAFIKERVNKIFMSPLVCGRISEFFEEDKAKGK